MARDWPADLWSTSFKGIPFWTRKVDAEFGKRLQKDQFPEQDLPFIQELGADLEPDQVDAYLVGDTSDADAKAFVAQLKSLGTGTFVHPVEGPITVWFEKGRRAIEMDRQGFIGFSLTFVRAGSTVSNVSADFLAQMVVDAADAALDAVSALASQLVLS